MELLSLLRRGKKMTLLHCQAHCHQRLTARQTKELIILKERLPALHLNKNQNQLRKKQNRFDQLHIARLIGYYFRLLTDLSLEMVSIGVVVRDL